MVRSVLFVCLGNICRSPTAEAVFRTAASSANLDIQIDSAGTSDWHIGDPPYGPMQRAAKGLGYDLSDLRARQFSVSDFYNFDLIIAMDESNLSNIEALRPSGVHTPVKKMLDFAPDAEESDVPDPYYTREYERSIHLIEAASEGLLGKLHCRDQRLTA